jgi:hypothetical protein
MKLILAVFLRWCRIFCELPVPLHDRDRPVRHRNELSQQTLIFGFPTRPSGNHIRLLTHIATPQVVGVQSANDWGF